MTGEFDGLLARWRVDNHRHCRKGAREVTLLSALHSRNSHNQRMGGISGVFGFWHILWPRIGICPQTVPWRLRARNGCDGVEWLSAYGSVCETESVDNGFRVDR